MTPETHIDDLEVVPNSIVSRKDGEAYTLDVLIESDLPVSESSYYTYARDHALYQLTVDDDQHFVELLDDVLADQFAQYGAVDETEPERLVGDMYEVLVRTVDRTEVAPYDSQFESNHAEVHITPDTDPEIVAHLDDEFDRLRDAVQSD